MRYLLSFFLVLSSRASYSMYIYVKNHKTQELKTYTTNEEFAIPADTNVHKDCVLSKGTTVEGWIVNCGVLDMDTKLANGSPQMTFNCNSSDRNLTFHTMNGKREKKSDKVIYEPAYLVTISCNSVKFK